MSKYHILKNTDLHIYFDDNSITTNVSPIKIQTPTDNNKNSSLLNKNGSFLHSVDHDLFQHEQPVHQQHFQIHNLDDKHDQKWHSGKNSYNHDEDLIHYNNDIFDNNPSTTKGRGSTKNIYTSVNKLGTPMDSATADDNTMEIPLLQHNFKTNSGNMKTNYNNKQYGFEYVCLCQQKGFATNLNNNSTQNAKSKILWAIALCCIFMVVEFMGGYIAGSLAIMADAAHLASDCISFVIGLVAIWLGCKPPDSKMSFGYKRFEVMGAIVSILGIWLLTATLVLVAIERIYSNEYDLDANAMMTISGIGILINIIMIFILHTSVLDLPVRSIGSSHGHSHDHSRSHNQNGHSHSLSHTPPSTCRRHSDDSGYLNTEYATRSLLPTDGDDDADVGAANDTICTSETSSTSIELPSTSLVANGNMLKHQQDGNDKNLNLRAAMIHVIGDLVQSFGVFLAAVLIKIFPKAVLLDPLCTLMFSIIVIMTTINLFKESMHLLMDSVPQGLPMDEMKTDLLNIEGVKSLHHLNVWNHTSNYSILMVHLVIDIFTDSNTVLSKATQLAGNAKYNIKHSTIQIERVTS